MSDKTISTFKPQTDDQAFDFQMRAAGALAALQAVHASATANLGNVTIPQSGATALAANTARLGYLIQNLGRNPLYVRRGAGASTTNYDFILAAGSADDDGTGGSREGNEYTGIITVAGTSPRYVASETV